MGYGKLEHGVYQSTRIWKYNDGIYDEKKGIFEAQQYSNQNTKIYIILICIYMSICPLHLIATGKD
jgi:hypothetical protein